MFHVEHISSVHGNPELASPMFHVEHSSLWKAPFILLQTTVNQRNRILRYLHCNPALHSSNFRSMLRSSLWFSN